MLAAQDRPPGECLTFRLAHVESLAMQSSFGFPAPVPMKVSAGGSVLVSCDSLYMPV